MSIDAETKVVGAPIKSKPRSSNRPADLRILNDFNGPPVTMIKSEKYKEKQSPIMTPQASINLNNNLLASNFSFDKTMDKQEFHDHVKQGNMPKRAISSLLSEDQVNSKSERIDGSDFMNAEPIDSNTSIPLIMENGTTYGGEACLWWGLFFDF